MAGQARDFSPLVSVEVEVPEAVPVRDPPEKQDMIPIEDRSMERHPVHGWSTERVTTHLTADHIATTLTSFS